MISVVKIPSTGLLFYQFIALIVFICWLSCDGAAFRAVQSNHIVHYISAQPPQAVMGSMAHMRPSRPVLPVDKTWPWRISHQDKAG